MQIPNIPTDNLYKFLSLSGIAIIIFCIVYPDYLTKQLNDLINENNTSIGLIELEAEYLDRKYKELGENVEKVSERMKDYNYEKDVKTIIDLKQIKQDLRNEKHRDYLKFIFQYIDEIIPEFKEYKENRKQLIELDELLYRNKINQYKIKRKNEINRKLVTKVKNVKRFSFLGKILGLYFAITGFYLWYTRVQKLLDEKIRLEIKEKS